MLSSRKWILLLLLAIHFKQIYEHVTPPPSAPKFPSAVPNIQLLWKFIIQPIALEGSEVHFAWVGSKLFVNGVASPYEYLLIHINRKMT